MISFGTDLVNYIVEILIDFPLIEFAWIVKPACASGFI